MWTLIVVIYWVHAPAITEIPNFPSQYVCEKAAVAVNKKYRGGYDNVASICVPMQ
jgi:hypothetical protein